MKASIAFVVMVFLQACAEDDPEVATKQQDERIEVNGCRTGTHEIDVGAGWECTDDYQPWWGPRHGDIGYERNPGLGGGRGGAGPSEGGGVSYMDPEPDHNKDRKSCHDWCDWDRRQCEKECRHRHPDRDMNERNRCIRSCDTKKNACKADCNRRFPERPIPTVSP